MKAKYIKRLEQIVRVLIELPKKKKLCLGCWMVCGTTGCVIGWAASDPWFKRRGFRLSERSRGLQPIYKDLVGLPAVEQYFGLSSKEAEHLFLDCSYNLNYRSKSVVIRRLRGFIKRKQRKSNPAPSFPQ